MPDLPNLPHPLHDLYHMTFKTLVGEAVLDDLVRQYHHRSSYVVGATNPVDLAFFEGQRSVVLMILGMLEEYELAHKAIVENESTERPGEYESAIEPGDA